MSSARYDNLWRSLATKTDGRIECKYGDPLDSQRAYLPYRIAFSIIRRFVSSATGAHSPWSDVRARHPLDGGRKRIAKPREKSEIASNDVDPGNVQED